MEEIETNSTVARTRETLEYMLDGYSKHLFYEPEHELEAVKLSAQKMGIKPLLPKFKMSNLYPTKFGGLRSLKLTNDGEPITSAHF